MDLEDLLIDLEQTLKEELERVFLDLPLTDSNCSYLQSVTRDVLCDYWSDLVSLNGTDIEIMISPTLDVHVMTPEEFESFYECN